MIHSPFPGMDPPLEAPTIWPDVHTTLMSIFRERLNPLFAPKHLAELETPVVIDRIDDDAQVVLPDVSITTPDLPAGSPPAVAVAEPAPGRVRVPMDVPTCLVSVYIRQRMWPRRACPPWPLADAMLHGCIGEVPCG
jgi:Protein of unknown function (DUF4058)